MAEVKNHQWNYLHLNRTTGFDKYALKISSFIMETSDSISFNFSTEVFQ